MISSTRFRCTGLLACNLLLYSFSFGVKYVNYKVNGVLRRPQTLRYIVVHVNPTGYRMLHGLAARPQAATCHYRSLARGYSGYIKGYLSTWLRMIHGPHVPLHFLGPKNLINREEIASGLKKVVPCGAK
jgi:hypothetical protein